jgi:hypothetical protein
LAFVEHLASYNVNIDSALLSEGGARWTEQAIQRSSSPFIKRCVFSFGSFANPLKRLSSSLRRWRFAPATATSKLSGCVPTFSALSLLHHRPVICHAFVFFAAGGREGIEGDRLPDQRPRAPRRALKARRRSP